MPYFAAPSIGVGAIKGVTQSYWPRYKGIKDKTKWARQEDAGIFISFLPESTVQASELP